MEGRIVASSICFLIVMLLASPAALAKHDPCELKGKSVCIAKSTAGEARLQAALDYACGHGADCGAIQPGAPCFNPDTRLAHASYAFNDYYQRQGRTPSACDFAGAAVIIQKKCKPIHFESQGCTSRSCNLDCFAKNPDKILVRAYCTHKHDLHYCHCLVCKRALH